MALLWFEGFDELPATLSAALLGSLGYTAPWGTLAGGRFGGQAFFLPWDPNMTLAIALPANLATLFFGAALLLQANDGNGLWAIALVDATAGTVQCTIYLNHDGSVSAADGSGNSLGATGPNAFLVNVWNYIEVGATVATAAGGGALTVRVNTVPVLTLSSVKTQQSANAWANQVGVIIPGYPHSGSLLCDDMYLCDGTGGAPYNTFLGNVRVQWLPPAGAGASTQFTPSNGADANWQCAGNTAVDDTLYVYASTAGDEDDYAVQPMASAPVVFGVQVKVAARQDNATQRFLETCLRSGATEVRDTAVALPQSYVFLRGALHTTDPNTGVGWTYTGVNAAQVGVNLST